MDKQATGTTFDGRSQVFEDPQTIMMLLKSVRKYHQQRHARDVRGLVAFFFLLWKKQWSTKRVYRLFSRPDKHAQLLKSYFKPLVQKLKFSTLVAKSDLRFKVH